jgi:hypothetical protein
MSDNPDEEVKKEEPPTFFGGLLKNVIYLIIYAIIGISILYGCKVASANIIPTTLDGCKLAINTLESFIDDGDGNMIPEKIFVPNVTCPQHKIETANINIIYKDEMYQSSKLEFSYKENQDRMINSGTIKWIMGLLYGSKSNHYSYFFGKILSSVLLTNLAIFDKMYKMINNIASTPFSESCVIFLLPYLLPIIFPFIILINTVLFVFSWFYYMSVFWAIRDPKPENEDDTHPVTVQWKNGQPNWWILLYYFIGFCLMFIPMMMGSVLGMIMPIYSIIFPLFATGHLKGSPKDDSFNFGDFIASTLKFKKHVFMYFFSYYVVMSAYKSNPTNGLLVAITAIVVIFIIWFFDNMFGVFKQYQGGKKDYLSVFSKATRSVGGEVNKPMPMPTPSQPIPPRQEEPIPRQEEPTPRQEEPIPTQEEPIPTQEEPIPTQEEPTPTQEEPTPTQEEPTPTQEEPIPENQRNVVGGRKRYKNRNTKKSR